ncbi:12263_t:CDS:1 [Acaulospora colombiana]|uniref:12263_t:CDS:1 n=1 Tax=Acaulospora colombiana TaxID=27376 RepID=A0ACA9KFM0_9GLOM|nr:12263_t:CDS:1 [Acaulospora colombiana]
MSSDNLNSYLSLSNQNESSFPSNKCRRGATRKTKKNARVDPTPYHRIPPVDMNLTHVQLTNIDTTKTTRGKSCPQCRESQNYVRTINKGLNKMEELVNTLAKILKA